MSYRTPRFWYKPHYNAFDYLKATILLPLAGVYWVISGLTRLFARPKSSPIFTICVGNLVAGGAGKTPVVQALVKLLQAQNLKPVILLRGYGGQAAGPIHVTPETSARDAGDEALLHAKVAHTIVARNRASGAALAAQSGAQIIIMDDGLQNTTLAPDLRLCVIDAAMGHGNGLLLPAGPLRQTLCTGLQNCDAAIIVNPSTQKPDTANLPVFTGHTEIRGNIQKGRRVIGFAGIGRPEKFRESLQSLEVDLIDFISFSDHKPYTNAEIKNLLARARDEKALLVTTEKDAARIPDKNDLLSIAVIKQQFVFDTPDDILNLIFRHEKFTIHR